MRLSQLVGGGDVPLGTALPSFSASEIVDRFMCQSGAVYQKIPGSLYGIESPADDNLPVKAPQITALAVSCTNSNTSWNSANAADCLIGKVGANYVAVTSGANNNTQPWGAWFATDFSSSRTDLSMVTLAAGDTNVVRIGGTYNVGSTSLLMSLDMGANPSKICRLVASGSVSLKATLTLTGVHFLAGNPSNNLFVAAKSVGGTLGNIYTATAENGSWTSRTPSGFGGPGWIRLLFWCPQANSGAGAFVYILRGDVSSTSSDGYTALASSAAPLPWAGASYDAAWYVNTETGYSNQHRIATSATATIVAPPVLGVYRTTNGLDYTLVLPDVCKSVWSFSGKFYAVNKWGYLYESSDDGLTWALKTVVHAMFGLGTNGRVMLNSARLIPGTSEVAFSFLDYAAGGIVVNFGCVTSMSATHVGLYRFASEANTKYAMVRVR